MACTTYCNNVPHPLPRHPLCHAIHHTSFLHRGHVRPDPDKTLSLILRPFALSESLSIMATLRRDLPSLAPIAACFLTIFVRDIICHIDNSQSQLICYARCRTASHSCSGTGPHSCPSPATYTGLSSQYLTPPFSSFSISPRRYGRHKWPQLCAIDLESSILRKPPGLLMAAYIAWLVREDACSTGQRSACFLTGLAARKGPLLHKLICLSELHIPRTGAASQLHCIPQMESMWWQAEELPHHPACHS
ncbi:hypothetical protein LIA77_05914 [Sarocladium implicatum]|nr:hypothetical protein LIA77_05914 [Sarocladium implicatum]